MMLLNIEILNSLPEKRKNAVLQKLQGSDLYDASKSFELTKSELVQKALLKFTTFKPKIKYYQITGAATEGNRLDVLVLSFSHDLVNVIAGLMTVSAKDHCMTQHVKDVVDCIHSLEINEAEVASHINEIAPTDKEVSAPVANLVHDESVTKLKPAKQLINAMTCYVQNDEILSSMSLLSDFLVSVSPRNIHLHHNNGALAYRELLVKGCDHNEMIEKLALFIKDTYPSRLEGFILSNISFIGDDWLKQLELGDYSEKTWHKYRLRLQLEERVTLGLSLDPVKKHLIESVQYIRSPILFNHITQHYLSSINEGFVLYVLIYHTPDYELKNLIVDRLENLPNVQVKKFFDTISDDDVILFRYLKQLITTSYAKKLYMAHSLFNNVAKDCVKNTQPAKKKNKKRKPSHKLTFPEYLKQLSQIRAGVVSAIGERQVNVIKTMYNGKPNYFSNLCEHIKLGLSRVHMDKLDKLILTDDVNDPKLEAEYLSLWLEPIGLRTIYNDTDVTILDPSLLSLCCIFGMKYELNAFMVLKTLSKNKAFIDPNHQYGVDLLSLSAVFKRTYPTVIHEFWDIKLINKSILLNWIRQANNLVPVLNNINQVSSPRILKGAGADFFMVYCHKSVVKRAENENPDLFPKVSVLDMPEEESFSDTVLMSLTEQINKPWEVGFEVSYTYSRFTSNHFEYQSPSLDPGDKLYWMMVMRMIKDKARILYIWHLPGIIFSAYQMSLIDQSSLEAYTNVFGFNFYSAFLSPCESNIQVVKHFFSDIYNLKKRNQLDPIFNYNFKDRGSNKCFKGNGLKQVIYSVLDHINQQHPNLFNEDFGGFDQSVQVMCSVELGGKQINTKILTNNLMANSYKDWLEKGGLYLLSSIAYVDQIIMKQKMRLSNVKTKFLLKHINIFYDYNSGCSHSREVFMTRVVSICSMFTQQLSDYGIGFLERYAVLLSGKSLLMIIEEACDFVQKIDCFTTESRVSSLHMIKDVWSLVDGEIGTLVTKKIDEIENHSIKPLTK